MKKIILFAAILFSFIFLSNISSLSNKTIKAQNALNITTQQVQKLSNDLSRIELLLNNTNKSENIPGYTTTSDEENKRNQIAIQSTINASRVAAQIQQQSLEMQQASFSRIIAASIIAIAIIIIIPLLASMVLTHRQERYMASKGINIRPITIYQLAYVL